MASTSAKRIRIVFLLLLLIGSAFFVIWQKAGTLYSNVSVNSEQTVKPTPVDPLAPYSVLLLGYGGGGHDGGYLTDTMIQVFIEPKKKYISLISIPRDFWVDLALDPAASSFHKINAAYAFGRDEKLYKNRPEKYKEKAGAGNLTKDAVQKVTGLPVDYFVSVSFSAFVKAIDKLGGVTVQIPHTFDDPLYPVESEKLNNCGLSEENIASITATLSGTRLEEQFPCRYEKLHFDKGPLLMNGETALKFARSRKSETFGGDHNRTLRQQALLTAVREKIISFTSIPSLIPFIETLSSDMQTDITPSDIMQKLKISPDINSYAIRTITIPEDDLIVESKSDDGQYIFIPKAGMTNYSEIHLFIKNTIEGITPSPSVSVK